MTSQPITNQEDLKKEKKKMRTKPLSVTLLSGFLGSGKTSLLKHVLQNRQGIKCAVIVNEITEENIDAYALGGTTLLQEKEQFLEMSNGCICCTLRSDLLKQLRDLADLEKNDVDCVLIESSGISEPMQVAQTFIIDLNDGLGPLNEVARLDNCVTVVDASTMLDRLRDAPASSSSSSTSAASSAIAAGLSNNNNNNYNSNNFSSKEVDAEGNPRNIGTLMAEQIEFANVVILNKIDKISQSGDEKQQQLQQEEEEKQKLLLVDTIKKLNPLAKFVVPTTHCKIPLEQVLDTNFFTEEFASSVKGWMTDLPETHTPETEEYGVVNYIFRSQTPFHPLRLHQWITQMWILEEMQEEEEEEEDNDESDSSLSDSDSDDNDQQQNKSSSSKKSSSTAAAAAAAAGVRHNRVTRYGGEIFRCKGFLWVGNPSRLGYYVAASAAGDTFSFLPGGGWSTFPVRAGSGTDKIEPCQKLAFLGQYLNKQQLQKDLESLLLTREEEAQLKHSMMKPTTATATTAAVEAPQDIFDDPFARFEDPGQEEEEEEGHHHHHHNHNHNHNHHNHNHNKKKN